MDNRNSIRSYLQKRVPGEVLQEILNTALKSPSWCNVQPYMVAVATGEKKDRLASAYSSKWDLAAATQKKSLPGKLLTLATNRVLPDGDFNVQFNQYPEAFIKRRQDCGYGLYQTLGIERHDRVGRDEQVKRNFEFFGAPVVMFIFVHESARDYGILDAGIFLQTLMLAANEKGLGCCAQGALATWRSPLEKEFEIPDKYKLLCGLSMGYASKDKVNSFSPNRITLEELTIPGSPL